MENPSLRAIAKTVVESRPPLKRTIAGRPDADVVEEVFAFFTVRESYTTGVRSMQRLHSLSTRPDPIQSSSYHPYQERQ